MTARASGTDIGLQRRLLLEARAYWLHLASIFVLDLASTPLALLAPVPVKIVVDSVLSDTPPPEIVAGLTGDDPGRLLAFSAGLVVAIALLVGLQGLGSWLLETWVGERLVLGLRARLFGHCQRLSLTFHDSRGTADSVYRVQYDAQSIQNASVHGVIPLVTSLVKLVAMIGVTAMLDVQLALVALVVAPVLYVLTQAYRKPLRRQWTRAKELESSALAVVQESLGAVRVVKAFGQEEREERRYVAEGARSVVANLRVVLQESGFTLLLGLTTGVGTAAVLWIGTVHVQAGVLTLGELLLVMGYLSQIYAPLKSIGRKVAGMQNALASADRAFALLDETPEVLDRPDARPLDRCRGAIELDGVAFAYEEGPPVFSGVSFRVEPGARVGISGPTGAGKTTLLSLLARFYDPTEGRVLLDGKDVRDVRLADLRRQFSIVLQEPILFSASIEENIAYGDPTASRERIEAAARAAGAHGFISGLQQGYATRVGERGMRLSGGERQRVAIARAFLKDAPILLLDEPTSSVDVETEAGIMSALERLMEGRTTFIIAHRLGTLDGCDVRLHVDRGRVREGSATGEVRR